MSWWSNANYKNAHISLDEIIYFTSLNLKYLKKNYDNVILITDKGGEQLFKNLNWSNIYLELDSVPKKYSDVWALGKLFCYRKIIEFKEPFIHIDYDFFITKKIPEDILNKPIITQSKEHVDRPSMKGTYLLEYFRDSCPVKNFAKNLVSPTAYNCGIVGGTDLNFFDLYSQSSIEMILNPKNEKFWTKSKNIPYYALSVLAEQYYLSIASVFLNRKVTCFFEAFDNGQLIEKNEGWYRACNIDFFKKTGCIHLVGDQKIRQKDSISKTLES